MRNGDNVGGAPVQVDASYTAQLGSLDDHARTGAGTQPRWLTPLCTSRVYQKLHEMTEVLAYLVTVNKYMLLLIEYCQLEV